MIPSDTRVDAELQGAKPHFYREFGVVEARTPLPDVLPPARLQVPRESQPLLPLRYTETCSSEQTPEQHSQYPGEHLEQRREQALLTRLAALGGPLEKGEATRPSS